MAQQNQDFQTFVGDSPAPIFLVVGADGVTPVDISAATQITWQALRYVGQTPVLIKTKTGGAITFPSGGTDGKFQLQLTIADTTNLSGWYVHTASITGASGTSVSTVTVGRMNVGLVPNWTWDPGSVGTIDLYTVRDLIGDVIQSDQQLSDQQVLASITRQGSIELAAAECCRKIAATYARQVDTVEGLLRTMYSSRRRNYMAMAADLEQRGWARSGITAYVGGTSIMDKNTIVDDTDRVPPQFVIAMFDNLLPESPVGHQTNANLGEPVNVGDIIGTS